MLKKIINIIKQPSIIILKLDKLGLIRLSDRKFIEYRFKHELGYEIDIDNPKLFNEKLQWLKLHDRNPLYTKLVDKYEVKKIIANEIGEEYIIPTIGIYNSFDEIDFSKLPNQFVVKCTHDSHSVVICTDKNNFDIDNCRKQIEKSLKSNYYYAGREWPYKDVKPRIIIDEYIEDTVRKELVDYKVYGFNGKCEYVMACFDRFSDGVKYIYYDKNWNMKPEFSQDGLKYGNSVTLPRPKNLNKMFEFASKLSKGIPFVRVDFYEANDRLYFGEMTFYPSSGFDNTRTKEVEDYLEKALEVNK